MCKAFPELNKQFEVKDAMSEIILLAKGRHYKITECYEADKATDPTTYRLNLYEEILESLARVFSQFICIDDNDDGITMKNTLLSSPFDHPQSFDIVPIGEHISEGI